MRGVRTAALLAVFSTAALSSIYGQQRPAPTGAPTTAKAAAPIDLAGYWVAFITEDWRFRMVTPHKGDFVALPLNDLARKVANAWDPAADEARGEQCKSYGAGAVMRLAARFHIAWENENTLRIDTDAGMQTRLLHFQPQSSPPGERTWQGLSTAQWQMGSLKVTTTNLRPGYLRKNGVPYSENASVTEYFDVAPLPSGGQVMLVTAAVDDPQYLLQPFTTSSQFKKESDGSKWDPTPCTAQ